MNTKVAFLFSIIIFNSPLESTGIINRGLKNLGLKPKEGFNVAAENTGVSKTAIQNYVKNSASGSEYTASEFNAQFDNLIENVSKSTGLPQESVKDYFSENISNGSSSSTNFLFNSVSDQTDYEDLVKSLVKSNQITEDQAGDVLQNLIDRNTITTDQANTMSDNLDLGRLYTQEVSGSNLGFEKIQMPEYPDGGEIYTPTKVTNTVKPIDGPTKGTGTIEKGPKGQSTSTIDNNDGQPQQTGTVTHSDPATTGKTQPVDSGPSSGPESGTDGSPITGDPKTGTGSGDNTSPSESIFNNVSGDTAEARIISLKEYIVENNITGPEFKDQLQNLNDSVTNLQKQLEDTSEADKAEIEEKLQEADDQVDAAETVDTDVTDGEFTFPE